MNKFETALNAFIIILSILFLISIFVYIKKRNNEKSNIYKNLLIITLLPLIICLAIKKKLYFGIYGISFIEMLVITLEVLGLYFIIWFSFFIIKSPKEKRLKILKTVLIIFVIWAIFFVTDFIRAKNQKLPIFASNFGGIFTYQDGGTQIYFGLGYQIYDFNTSVNFPNQPDVPSWDNFYILKIIYFCPWGTSFNEALKKVQKEPDYIDYLYK